MPKKRNTSSTWSRNGHEPVAPGPIPFAKQPMFGTLSHRWLNDVLSRHQADLAVARQSDLQTFPGEPPSVPVGGQPSQQEKPPASSWEAPVPSGVSDGKPCADFGVGVAVSETSLVTAGIPAAPKAWQAWYPPVTVAMKLPWEDGPGPAYRNPFRDDVAVMVGCANATEVVALGWDGGTPPTPPPPPPAGVRGIHPAPAGWRHRHSQPRTQFFTIGDSDGEAVCDNTGEDFDEGWQ